MKSDSKPRKIYINGRFLTQTPSGIYRYAYELVQALDDLIRLGEIDQKEYRLELIAPHFEGSLPSYEFIPIRQVGGFKGDLWEQIELPWFTRGELLFSPCDSGPIFKRKQIAAIHDISVFSVPGSYTNLYREARKVFLSVLIKSAISILVDSRTSIAEVLKYIHIVPYKVHFIPFGSNRMLHTQPDPIIFQKYNLGQRPFFLALGSVLPHDNLDILVRTINSIPRRKFDLIILAEGYKSIFPSVTVSDGELKALYQHAMGVVFPTLYHGYGLDLLDAMSCGCPVICSKNDYFNEFCGNAALYFNPQRSQDIAQSIFTVMIDPSLRRWLRDKGIWRVEKFTWISTAQQTWKICVNNLSINGNKLLSKEKEMKPS